MKIYKGVLKYFIVFVAVLTLTIIPSTVRAEKLTGGAEWTEAGPHVFSVTANALTTPRGDIKGHIQYSREDQSIPDCFIGNHFDEFL